MQEAILDLLMILAAGLVAGAVCRRRGVPMLIGYLVAGVLIGRGALDLVVLAGAGSELRIVEELAQAGVLLLLFSIGLEFSFEELAKMGLRVTVGGAAQMTLTALPVAALLHYGLSLSQGPALLLGFAVSLSSTVLVFRALSEYGQAAAPPSWQSVQDSSKAARPSSTCCGSNRGRDERERLRGGGGCVPLERLDDSISPASSDSAVFVICASGAVVTVSLW